MSGQRRKIVIVGGGVLGSSTAYHLAKLGNGEFDITVLERDSSYRIASSALSGSGIRQQYSTPENIRLAQYSFDFLSRANETLATANYIPEVGLHEKGYLVLAGAESAELMREQHAFQASHGVSNVLLDPTGLGGRFDWISNDAVSLACLGTAGEGWFDGYGLLQAFVHKAKELGVTYRTTNVSALLAGSDRAKGVRLADGQEIDADVVVVAAGCWTADIMKTAGIEVPIAPRRRDIFSFACNTEIADCPLVVDPSGMWFRPEGHGRFICGAPPNSDPDGGALDVDWQQWEETLWPALATRVPAFEAIKMTGGWAGYYEMNTLDHNGIVGAHDVIDNLLIVAGFSGHGMMMSPGVGLSAAEIVMHGGPKTIDIARLGWQRIVDKQPFEEHNVI